MLYISIYFRGNFIMKMLVAHSGRTGKDSSITFDTERKVFCRGRADHNVFIYAEKKSDVDGVVRDLIHRAGGFVEVSLEEFENGCENVTTRVQMQELKKGDEFFVNGKRHIATTDAHVSGDATCDEHIVYDEKGEGWFEKDFPEVA